MRRSLVIGMTIVFVITLLAYSMTYSVRFTESAILTTFGKASETDIRSNPGLKFKWPYPVQDVTKYDTRVRFVQVMQETQQTSDSKQINVEVFCTWRVANPLKFFRTFSSAGASAQDHYTKAEDTIRSNLRAAAGATSSFRLDELLTREASASKFPELEAAILETMSQGASGGVKLDEYGVEIVDAGVSLITLPEETTKAVFDRMQADRELLIKQIKADGEAQAQAIRTQAENTAKKIEAFADEYAKRIRAQGDAEAKVYVEQMAKHPDLAIFLMNIDMLRNLMSTRTTLVLPTSTPGLELLDPDAMDGKGAGQFPSTGSPKFNELINEEPDPARKADGGRP